MFSPKPHVGARCERLGVMAETTERRRAAKVEQPTDDEKPETPPKEPQDERAHARAQAAEYLY
jgi:hypothetical protein